ncbi:putative spermidine/putrescine transport system permease protein [Thermomonospora echinospora]|uniref:Putative spermidine/putrescine transport system permease protein n=1 Tax=Thermomonospora echinospora TaxID=1992 RepID=A0A1H5SNG8_9ACTN|nr:ABC transporter permease [Thermomonospora echinospora]SEF51994.1 putative spermidine/putrescine transport system permease protein [Thermomonospora echinospora]
MAVLDEAPGAARPTAGPAAPGRAPRERGAARPAVLLLPALVLVLVFFAYPLATMLWRAFTEPETGWGNFTWFFTTQANIDVLVRTFTTALWVTVIALLLSYPYAYLMTVAGPRGRAALTLLVLVPFWTSLMVRTFAWMVILQDTGVLNRTLDLVGLGPVHLIRTQAGVIVGMVQLLMPFMVLPLYAVMSGIDRRYVQAARSLGARPLTAFAGIYLPLSLPGIAAGSLMVFVSALGFYITPALLGSPDDALISQQIFTQVNGLLQWGRGGAMGVVLLGMTLALLVLVALVTRRAGRKVSL